MQEWKLTKGAVASILFVALAICGRASQNSPVVNHTVARVSPERVAGDPTRDNHDVSQFLAADAKGRVLFLHGDTLAVDQILPSGKIVSWRKPQGKEGSDAGVREAALSPDGSVWLLASGVDDLSVLSDNELHPLPTPHWWVSSLTYTTDGPVLAVLPSWGGGTDAASKVAWDKPPFLLRLDGQAWQTLTAQEALVLSGEPKSPVMPSFEQIKGERDVKLAAGRNGAFWATLQNAYLLKRYSKQGTVEESVALNGGRVQWKERSEEDWKALEKVAQAAGRTLNRAHRLSAGAVRVVRGLTAQDNRVYQVIETPEGVALDRWDAQAEVLDRLLLDGITPGPRYLSVAAGRDGLYIAARGMGEPIWRLDWQRL
ncbi:MAG TPA: hypothetical protein VMW75_11800, partial [Thermoanaerobaculia bacterium]|nr:hypothetical protein [Thermoanaerobaculia bacterium]